MSQPIYMCDVYKAALGDEEKYKELVKDMKFNREYGSWSLFPCGHEPPCEVPTDDQLDKLNERLNKEDWPPLGDGDMD